MLTTYPERKGGPPRTRCRHPARTVALAPCADGVRRPRCGRCGRVVELDAGRGAFVDPPGPPPGPARGRPRR